jgi:hypothetical protein
MFSSAAVKARMCVISRVIRNWRACLNPGEAPDIIWRPEAPSAWPPLPEPYASDLVNGGGSSSALKLTTDLRGCAVFFFF